jgi:hypothetical protein
MTLEAEKERLDSRGVKIGNRASSESKRKLTDEQAIKMVNDWKQGTHFKVLIKQYGIAVSSFWTYTKRVKQGIIKAS